VEVRVGDAKVDNTGFVAPDARGHVRVAALPLDDDYLEIRRQLWLATDNAYKAALEDLSKKRALLQSRTRSDESPDFSSAEKVEAAAARAPLPPLRLAELETLARDLSAVFRGIPDLTATKVSVTGRHTLTRYVNSEGTAFTHIVPRASVLVSAAAQAEDGTPLEDLFTAYGRSLADLPAPTEMKRQAGELGRRVSLLRQAPHLETYNGPVLFEAPAAAELLAQVLAPKLLATRIPLADSRMGDLGSYENPFLDRIGGRVLPETFTVTDDPRRVEHAGAPLLGGYEVDDEGVRARETRLVENGILKALLSTRSPVRGVLASTGNRRGGGPLPSNLIVTSSAGVTPAALKEALLKRVQERGGPYGLIVRRIGNPATLLRPHGTMRTTSRERGSSLEAATWAVKVLPDGSEEPIRIAEIVGLSAESFKEIAAASNEPAIHNAYFQGPNLPGSYSTVELVSFVVPSLLFPDMSLRKPGGEIPRPPVGSRPPF
jgi:hypothetical protein